MAYYWFSPYTGNDWTPQKGYNPAFREVVQHIRDWFGLARSKTPGTDVSTGIWREYKLHRREVHVIVDEFRWAGVTNRNGFPSPQFRLRLRVATAGFMRKDVFYKETLVIDFPRTYPANPPSFWIDNQQFLTESSAHAHHIISRTMCILAGSGDWNPKKDTIIRGINAALEWIVWHYDSYRW